MSQNYHKAFTTMHAGMLRPIRTWSVILFASIALTSVAKIPGPPFGAAIRSSGVTWPLINGVDSWLELGTVHLTPGDSLLLWVEVWYSNSGYSIWRDGTMYHSEDSMLAQTNDTLWITTPGSYSGGGGCWICDFDSYVSFTLTYTTSSASICRVYASAVLDGARATGNSSAMREDLRLLGLIPVQEPYSALGFIQIGSGGETMPSSWMLPSSTYHVVDWVHLELRSAVVPSVVVATANALLLQDGYIISPTGSMALEFQAPPGKYYVTLRHRNHFGVMTSAPVPLTAQWVYLDFVHGHFPVFGSEPMKEILYYSWPFQALWPGNVQHQLGAEQIKYTGTQNDRDPILLKIGGVTPTATTTGYWLEDTNLDGVVKYTGANNDRDLVLSSIGGVVPTNTRTEQLP
jgi:hypothetical protein